MDLEDKVGKFIAVVLLVFILVMFVIARIDQAKLQRDVADGRVSIAQLSSQIESFEFELAGRRFVCRDNDDDGDYDCGPES